MQAREKAYLELLHEGIVAIRNYACAGQIKLCEIEADHLHNLWTLFDQPNEALHLYYIEVERSCYVDRLKQMGAKEYLNFMKMRYSESWKVLASTAGVELTE